MSTIFGENIHSYVKNGKKLKQQDSKGLMLIHGQKNVLIPLL